MTAPPNAGRVLIIEDDDAVRGVMNDLLAREGFQTVPVDTGEAAIAALKATPGGFAAIVCDVALPGMSGPEALASAGVEALGKAGVVFLSGLTHAPDVHLEAGRKTARLSKPFEPAGLAQTVRSVCA